MKYIVGLVFVLGAITILAPLLYAGFKIIVGMWSEMIEDFRS